MLPKLSNTTLRFGCVSKIQTIKAGVRLPASSRVPGHYQATSDPMHGMFVSASDSSRLNRLLASKCYGSKSVYVRIIYMRIF